MQESKDDRIDLRKGFNEHTIAITEIRSDARETREDIVEIKSDIKDIRRMVS